MYQYPWKNAKEIFMIRQNNKWTVGAVIVIYFPEQEVLDRLLRALAVQVAYMVVVDNGAMESTRSFLQGLAAEVPSLEILCQRLANPLPEKMAIEIAALLANPYELKARRQAGLEFINTFPSEEEMARRIESLILKRLSQKTQHHV